MRLAIRMACVTVAMLVVMAGGLLRDSGFGVAAAQRVEGDRASAQGLYQAEVSVRSQSESERNIGFARGLQQVIGRLSGDRNASARPGVGQELRNARQYVGGYDYRQDEGISPTTGAPTYDTTLVVRYDQDKVDNMVAALGLPVWPQPRPKPVLWLAIDDGHGPRLVGLAQSSAARSVLDRAVDRGFKLGLPSGTAAEQAAVGAIWRGDTAAVARLSSRYSPPMQLIGKLSRSDAGWSADWTFVDSGRVLSTWTSAERDARRAMAAGADGAADALVRRYAKASAAGPAGIYRVVFAGINSSEDYMRLSGYLQGLPVVRRVIPVHATPDGLQVDLDLATGLSGFRRLLNDDVLQDEEGDPPVFRLH
ncbi:MAG TPA: DUF2066 domain-containing protein [Luteimonas sp.]|nr:DUF2066 domain-containing protein [Luteimonas sp.]